MQLEPIDAVWLDAQREYTIAELERCSGLSQVELRELVDYGVLTPTDPKCAEWSFAGEIAVTVQAAGRLRDDLELDAQALALALTLIGRIRELEAQLRSLRAQLPHRTP